MRQPEGINVGVVPDSNQEVEQSPADQQEEGQEIDSATAEQATELDQQSPEQNQGESVESLDGVRSIGRERWSRMGSIIGNRVDAFASKAVSIGKRVWGATKKTAEMAGTALEYAAAPDELAKVVKRKGGAFVREKYNQAKDKVVEVRDKVVDFAVTKVEDVADFGRMAAARATERLTKPIERFQTSMLSIRINHLAERAERGKKINPEELRRLSEKVALLEQVRNA